MKRKIDKDNYSLDTTFSPTKTYVIFNEKETEKVKNAFILSVSRELSKKEPLASFKVFNVSTMLHYCKWNRSILLREYDRITSKFVEYKLFECNNGECSSCFRGKFSILLYCPECGNFYCYDCVLAHLKRQIKNHKLTFRCLAYPTCGSFIGKSTLKRIFFETILLDYLKRKRIAMSIERIFEDEKDELFFRKRVKEELSFLLEKNIQYAFSKENPFLRSVPLGSLSGEEDMDEYYYLLYELPKIGSFVTLPKRILSLVIEKSGYPPKVQQKQKVTNLSTSAANEDSEEMEKIPYPLFCSLCGCRRHLLITCGMFETFLGLLQQKRELLSKDFLNWRNEFLEKEDINKTEEKKNGRKESLSNLLLSFLDKEQKKDEQKEKEDRKNHHRKNHHRKNHHRNHRNHRNHKLVKKESSFLRWKKEELNAKRNIQKQKHVLNDHELCSIIEEFEKKENTFFQFFIKTNIYMNHYFNEWKSFKRKNILKNYNKGKGKERKEEKVFIDYFQSANDDVLLDTIYCVLFQLYEIIQHSIIFEYFMFYCEFFTFLNEGNGSKEQQQQLKNMKEKREQQRKLQKEKEEKEEKEEMELIEKWDKNYQKVYGFEYVTGCYCGEDVKIEPKPSVPNSTDTETMEANAPTNDLMNKGNSIDEDDENEDHHQEKKKKNDKKDEDRYQPLHHQYYSDQYHRRMKRESDRRRRRKRRRIRRQRRSSHYNATRKHYFSSFYYNERKFYSFQNKILEQSEELEESLLLLLFLMKKNKKQKLLKKKEENNNKKEEEEDKFFKISFVFEQRQKCWRLVEDICDEIREFFVFVNKNFTIHQNLFIPSRYLFQKTIPFWVNFGFDLDDRETCKQNRNERKQKKSIEFMEKMENLEKKKKQRSPLSSSILQKKESKKEEEEEEQKIIKEEKKEESEEREREREREGRRIGMEEDYYFFLDPEEFLPEILLDEEKTSLKKQIRILHAFNDDDDDDDGNNLEDGGRRSSGFASSDELSLILEEQQEKKKTGRRRGRRHSSSTFEKELGMMSKRFGQQQRKRNKQQEKLKMKKMIMLKGKMKKKKKRKKKNFFPFRFSHSDGTKSSSLSFSHHHHRHYNELDRDKRRMKRAWALEKKKSVVFSHRKHFKILREEQKEQPNNITSLLFPSLSSPKLGTSSISKKKKKKKKKKDIVLSHRDHFRIMKNKDDYPYSSSLRGNRGQQRSRSSGHHHYKKTRRKTWGYNSSFAKKKWFKNTIKNVFNKKRIILPKEEESYGSNNSSSDVDMLENEDGEEKEKEDDDEGTKEEKEGEGEEKYENESNTTRFPSLNRPKYDIIVNKKITKTKKKKRKKKKTEVNAIKSEARVTTRIRSQSSPSSLENKKEHQKRMEKRRKEEQESEHQQSVAQKLIF